MPYNMVLEGIYMLKLLPQSEALIIDTAVPSEAVDFIKSYIEFYKKNNMPVVAYSSQAKGFFSKMAEQGESALSEKARKRYLCEENLNRLEVLKKLSSKHNVSVAAIICAAFSSFESSSSSTSPGKYCEE